MSQIYTYFVVVVIIGSLFVFFSLDSNIATTKLADYYDDGLSLKGGKDVTLPSRISKKFSSNSKSVGVHRRNEKTKKKGKIKRGKSRKKHLKESTRSKRKHRFMKLGSGDTHAKNVHASRPTIFVNISQDGKEFEKRHLNIYEEWTTGSSLWDMQHSATPKRQIKETEGVKTILIYTTLFDNPEWPHLKIKETENYLKSYNCPVKNCDLSYDTHQISKSDVVIFHARDIKDGPGLLAMNDLERPANQIWVYFSSESPLSSNIDPSIENLFDWSMTYKYGSDIWIPYARYHKQKSDTEHGHHPVNFAKTKNKLMSWLASNCGLLRDEVVYEIEQHLPVDVAGKCAGNFERTFLCGTTEDCDRKISEYKFYLAFESQHCDGYVTEKYWYRAIRNDVVPIVLGAGPYDDPRVAIPGSFINILDFDTVADFAKYINYLDRNDTAYNEYFKWKQKYKLWDPVCDWPFEPYWACDICIRLNNGAERQLDHKLSDVWGISKNCEGRMARLQRFLERSGHDFTKNHSAQQMQEVSPFDSAGIELEYVKDEEVTRSHDTPEFDASVLQSKSASQNFVIAFLFISSVIGFILYFAKVYYI